MSLPHLIRRALRAARLAPLFLAVTANCATAQTPASATADKQLKTIFRQLGADDFVARENAQIELQKLATAAGDEALEKTLDQYLSSKDPEVRVRLRAAMFNAVAANTRRRGFIGIQMDIGMAFRPGGQVERQNTVRVRHIIPGSAADSFGLRPGDEITELDGKPFANEARAMPPTYQLKDYVSSLAEGDTLRLSIRRNGKVQQQEVKLGGMPDDLDPAFKEKAFEKWMRTELVERGLAEPPVTIMPRAQIPRQFIPDSVPDVVPIPKENLFPKKK